MKRIKFITCSSSGGVLESIVVTYQDGTKWEPKHCLRQHLKWIDKEIKSQRSRRVVLVPKQIMAKLK